MNMRFTISIISLQLLATVLPALASDYNLQPLEKAHGMFRAATNAVMYAEAAEQYGYLVEEEGIRNGHLLYTLGNCWFMAGDTGRAILNYRRAQLFLPNHADTLQNLEVARDMRTDLIPEKEPHPLAAKLLGWHFNTSTTLRWWLFAFCWTLLWGAWLWMSRTTKKEARIATIATGVLSALLLTSLLTEYALRQQAQPGVVTAMEVLARKGDGNMYAPAFMEPLHSGTEFHNLEERGMWRYIRLADGQTCWIPAAAAETIRFR